MRVARQAIRSQVTAREYTERQLVQAQNIIEELRTKLRHVHHDREVAVAAAQSAIAAQDTAERSARAAESALASERAARGRVEGRLRDAEATIRDLREKLAMANQTIHATQAELTAERLNRQKADDGVIAVAEAKVQTVRGGGLPVVKRPVGRPRKVALAQPPPTMIGPVEEPQARVSPNVDAVVSTFRRPVGRPRKLVVAEPISAHLTQPKKAQVSDEVMTNAAKPKQQDQRRRADDQEPVQWWVEGWRNR